jgi:hypothetical protein
VYAKRHQWWWCHQGWSCYHGIKWSKAVLLHHAGINGERRYCSYSFFTSELDGVRGQGHAPAALYSRERTPSTHCVGGSVCLGVGLDSEARGKTLCLCQVSNCVIQFSQTLYWLSYPNSHLIRVTKGMTNSTMVSKVNVVMVSRVMWWCHCSCAGGYE